MDIRQKLYQMSEGARFGGLFTPAQCSALAKKLIQIYDGNSDNIIDNMEVCNLMTDTYRSINKDFKPTPTDTVKFSRVITRTSERANITLDDLEKTCLRLFGTEQGQSPQNIHTATQYVFTSSQAPAKTSQVQQIEQARRAPRPKWLEERLDLARKIFRNIDRDNSGHITSDEVYALLMDTCKNLGLNYVPTE